MLKPAFVLLLLQQRVLESTNEVLQKIIRGQIVSRPENDNKWWEWRRGPAEKVKMKRLDHPAKKCG